MGLSVVLAERRWRSLNGWSRACYYWASWRINGSPVWFFHCKTSPTEVGKQNKQGQTKSSEQNEPHQKKGTKEGAKRHKDYALFTS